MSLTVKGTTPYQLKGDFNSWSDGATFEKDETTGLFNVKQELSAGDEFKITDSHFGMVVKLMMIITKSMKAGAPT